MLLSAALPGGIGNTGGECGGLPDVVDEGHDLLQRARDRHGTTDCRQILGNARVPVRCVGVAREAPAMCAHCSRGPVAGTSSRRSGALMTPGTI